MLIGQQLRSGSVKSGTLGSQVVFSGNIASGLLGGGFSLSSGVITSGYIGNKAVLSGNIGSGQIAAAHISSGTVLPGSGISITLGLSGITIATTSGIGGPGLVTLEQHTASNSSGLVFNNWYSPSFDEYEIHFVNLLPGNDGVTPLMQVSSNGGGIYDSGTNYAYQYFEWDLNATAAGGVNNGQTSIPINGNQLISSSGSNGGLCGRMRMYSPGSTSMYKMFDGQFSNREQSTTSWFGYMINYQYLNTASGINAFQIYFNAGNIVTGTVRIYGVGH